MKNLLMTVLVVLVMCGVSWGTQYYIDPASTTGDGSSGDPWGTFNECYAEMADGDHIVDVKGATYSPAGAPPIYIGGASGGFTGTVTFRPVTGETVIITGSSSQQAILVSSNPAATFTFEDMTIIVGVSTNTVRNDDADTSLAFTRCSIGQATYNQNTIVYNTAATNARSLTLTGCTVTSGGLGITAKDVTNGLTLINTNITAAANSALYVLDDVGKIYISGGTLVSTVGLSVGVLTSCTSIELNGVAMVSSAQAITIPNNDIAAFPIVIDNCRLSTVGSGIYIGSNTTGAIYTDPNLTGPVFVRNNVVKKTGAGGGHGLLIGKGCDVGGEVSNNFIDDSSANDYAAVFKCSNTSVIGNTFIGGFGLTIKGAAGCVFRNNTCKATVDSALLFFNDPAGGGNPEKVSKTNSITNNIFYSVGTYCVKTSDSAHLRSLMDYNSYFGGSTSGWFDGDTTSNKTLAQYVASFSAATLYVGTANESHAVYVDPQLDSNYKPKSSALQNTGSPSLLKSDGTVLERNSIGAGWKTGGSSPFSRTRRGLGN